MAMLRPENILNLYTPSPPSPPDFLRETGAGFGEVDPNNRTFSQYMYRDVVNALTQPVNPPTTPTINMETPTIPHLTNTVFTLAAREQQDRLIRRLKQLYTVYDSSVIACNEYPNSISFGANIEHPSLEVLVNTEAVFEKIDFNSLLEGLERLPSNTSNSYSFLTTFRNHTYRVNLYMVNGATMMYTRRFLGYKPSYFVYKKILKRNYNMDLELGGLYLNTTIAGENRKILIDRSPTGLQNLVGIYESHNLSSLRFEDFISQLGQCRLAHRQMFSEDDIETADPLLMNVSIYRKFLETIRNPSIYFHSLPFTEITPGQAKANADNALDRYYPSIKEYLKQEEGSVKLNRMIEDRFAALPNITDPEGLNAFISKLRNMVNSESEFLQLVLGSNAANLESLIDKCNKKHGFAVPLAA